MKKVLIITYYWPPAGGPGVQRVLKIVENLPSQGWEPLILTVEDPSAPARDKDLIKRIPDHCKIFKTKTREPFNAYKKLTGKSKDDVLPKNISLNSSSSLKEKLSRWIRANLFVPDARKGWKRYMIKEGLKIIKNEKPDVIFSTSPPHSLQTGAEHLARKSGLPWICDLRDPWTEAYWETHMPKTRVSQKRNRTLERRALNGADHITTVGKSIRDLLASKTAKPVSVIYNGYSEVNTEAIKTKKFQIVHLGNLSNMQYADTLYEALKKLKPEEQNDIKLCFIGHIAEEHKLKIALLEHIDTEYLDFLPHDKMMQKAREASLLFLPKLDSSYSKGLISAKLFDYLALRRPILAITDLGSDIADILNKTDSGKSFLPNEHREISHYITELLIHWQTSGTVVFENTKALKRFSVIRNTASLVEIFEKTRKNT